MCPGRSHVGRAVRWQEKELVLTYQQVEYAVKLAEGTFVSPYLLKSREHVLELRFL